MSAIMVKRLDEVAIGDVIVDYNSAELHDPRTVIQVRWSIERGRTEVLVVSHRGNVARWNCSGAFGTIPVGVQA